MINWGAFLTYSLLTAFTPGPNNIVAMSNTSSYGFKKSIRLIQGIFIGFLCVMILCSIFSVMLAKMIPKIKFIMAYIGVAYILWLAWHIIKSKPTNHNEAIKKTNNFITGFLLQFTNVKIILYGITLISNFVIPHYKQPIIICGFILLITVFGWSGTFTWAICGALFQRIFEKNKIILNIVMAILLVYCAITLII